MKPITTIRKAPMNPILMPYIKYFWSLKAPAHVSIDQWLVPVCNGDLVVNLIGSARCTDTEGTVTCLEGASICGIRRHCTRIEQSGPIHVIGAAFYPAGLYPFINGSIDITVDRTFPAKKLMPAFNFVLPEDLLGNESASMDLLEDSLLAVIGDADTQRLIIPEIVTEFCTAKNMDKIKNFCAINGISPRTLERFIKKYVGITPREFNSLARMQEAVRGMIDNPETPLTEQAYEYGYYDQPHFTREFREKLKRTPSDFIFCSNTILETIRHK